MGFWRICTAAIPGGIKQHRLLLSAIDTGGCHAGWCKGHVLKD
jgi:hypothetical protein